MANFCPLSSTLFIIFLCEDEEIEMKRILANFLALYNTLNFNTCKKSLGRDNDTSMIVISDKESCFSATLTCID